MVRSGAFRRRRALLMGAGVLTAMAGGVCWWRGRRKIEDLLGDLATLLSFAGPLPPESTASHARTLQQGLAELFEPGGTVEVDGWDASSLRVDAIVGDLMLLRDELESLTLTIERVVEEPRIRSRLPALPRDAKGAAARASALLRRKDGSTETRRADLDVAARGRPLALAGC